MKEVVSGEGYVINPGFSTSMDWNFDKSKVHTRESRIKEWEFYQLLDGDWVFQATVGHASIFGSYSVRLFNLMTKESYSLERLEFHTAKISRFKTIQTTTTRLKSSVKTSSFPTNFLKEKRLSGAKAFQKHTESVKSRCSSRTTMITKRWSYSRHFMNPKRCSF